MTKRDAYLRRTYGLTSRQYKLMVADQGGVCWICQKPPKPGSKLHVDHNHRTGVVRGGLCWRCNKHVIGRRTDVVIFERAALYLRRTIDWRNV